VRSADDLEVAGRFDLMIECSAEPSVHAGYDGSPAYLINTNLLGTLNCLERLRRSGGKLIFLSTSRVYPIAALRALPLREAGGRFVIAEGASGSGWSERGIAEDYTLKGSRSLYGATKLASELVIEEYAALYGLQAIVNRCGVLTGPWQMGKVDQGFVVLWMARHMYGGQLGYIGYGGKGLQVRDILHVADLYDLLELQISQFDRHNGQVYNVGGGAQISVSLRELTERCRRLTGKTIDIGSQPDTRAADVPYFVTDSSLVHQAAGWRPRRTVDTILEEIGAWLKEYRNQLSEILG
jgi:CDP-paratose 2-epimerase